MINQALQTLKYTKKLWKTLVFRYIAKAVDNSAKL